jgi:hypothetical protein
MNYLSRRVKKTLFENLPPDRYEYLRLADAEPNLGRPSEPLDSVLVGRSDGSRTWAKAPEGLSLRGQLNTITQRLSYVQDYAPDVTDLEFGEILLNVKDAKLFYKRLDNNDNEVMYSLPEISGNLDGGRPDSIYGGSIVLDGGAVIN